MGIRLALGAGTRRVFLLVLRDGMWLVGLGAAIGLAAAAFGARSLSAFLYGISPQDVPSFAVAVALLAVVASIACAIPGAAGHSRQSGDDAAAGVRTACPTGDNRRTDVQRACGFGDRARAATSARTRLDAARGGRAAARPAVP